MASHDIALPPRFNRNIITPETLERIAPAVVDFPGYYSYRTGLRHPINSIHGTSSIPSLPAFNHREGDFFMLTERFAGEAEVLPPRAVGTFAELMGMLVCNVPLKRNFPHSIFVQEIVPTEENTKLSIARAVFNVINGKNNQSGTSYLDLLIQRAQKSGHVHDLFDK